jgi:Tol biopolymer transport system component
MKLLRISIFLFFIIINLSAQFNEFYPEYDWLTIKGERIYVHFHPEAERTARVVAKIADEVWGPITSLYEYEPETVHYVIKDIDDYANGATYFFDNKIEIWASALDFDLRGTHNWLRNVISHEFTHLVQIQAGMKLTRTLPAFYLQWLNYEDKRRPDILYGFPNVIVSYPLATINMPAWFAEGTAQYMREEFNYDNWDTHRDMILRSYALDNNMLTWNEMGVFGKTSLGNESVYNSGFALTRYIAQKYGEDKLREVTKKLGKLSNFTIDAAFEDVLGKDGDEIYNEWSAFLKEDYTKRIAEVKDNLVQGEEIVKEGFGNFYPEFSKDGTKIYYVSNKGADYFGLSSIYEYDLETKKEKSLVDGVRSTIGVVADDDKLIYAKLTEENKNWVNIHDLFVYDKSEDESTRLTFGLRASNPAVSHDGKKIVFLFQKDGTTNLGSVDIDGKNFKQLTVFANGEQVYNPKFSTDDKYVIFGYSIHNGRDIAKVNLDGSGFEKIIATDFDERNPYFINENEFVYSSDQTGIFNLYTYNLDSKQSKRITNVIGGAFMPSVRTDGNIAYAGYTSSGYKLFYITNDEQSRVDNTKKYEWISNPPLEQKIPNGDIQKFNLERLANFDDSETPDYEKSKYSGFFSKLTFFPRIRFDNYNTTNNFLEKLKPGVYVASNDVLNRYSLFAGGSINSRFERDLFLQFEYRNKLPLLFDIGLKPDLGLEIYSVSRKADTDIIFDSLSANQVAKTDVSYDLFEVDLVAKHKIFNEANELELRFIFSQYVATIGSFILPQTSILYPTTKDKYFVGRNFQLKYTTEYLIPHIDSDISPVGRRFELQYNYEFNKYNKDGEYEVVDGALLPVYQDFNFHKIELNYWEHMSLGKGHTLSGRFRGGTILGPTQPDFFDYYLGGLIGMKAYPFYSISGNELMWFNLSYRFPLFKNIDARAGHLYLDKIFFGLFADLGNAWNGKMPEINKFKKGVGAELRVKLNSFYLFPTSFFVSASYAFDETERVIRGERIVYGKEWNFYGGITFDFTIIN